MGRKTGNRRERRVEEIYEEAGYHTERSQGQRWGRTDWFGIVDLMAVAPGAPVRFVQVKSESASGIRKAFDKASTIFPDDHVEMEYVVYHKRAGFRLLRPVDGTYETVYDERKDDDLNMGEGLKAFLRDEREAAVDG